jgi:hypothetical protein
MSAQRGQLRLRGTCARVALALLVVIVVAGPATANAQASSVAAASSAPPPQHASAAQAGGIAETVCGLLKKPVSYGVNRIVSLLTKGRVQGTLAGSLFADIGFNPWCRKQYAKLKKRLQGVAQKKPSLRSRLGPFVFNLRATYRVLSNQVDRFEVTWLEFSPSSPLRTYYLYYRINEGRWVPRNSKFLNVYRGNRVQFAVRVDNQNRISSPWVYSLDYNVP